MSAGESESESENELLELTETTEVPETAYTLMQEEEFGTVNKIKDFSKQLIILLLFF